MKLYPIEKSDSLILYDFSNLAYTVYHSQAYSKLQTSGGVDSGVVYGAFKKVISQVKDLASNRRASLIFALDEFPTHKRELVSSYKANRTPLPSNEDPRTLLKPLFAATNSYFARVKAQEADDVLASLAHQYQDKEVFIVSSDYDLLQLKRYSHVEIYHLIRSEFMTEEFLLERFGLTAWNKIPIFKAIFGDTSDNIKPALPRVRKKDVLPIINGTEPKLKSFMAAFAKSKQTPKTMETYSANIQNLKNNYKIVKLNRNLEVQFKRNKADKQALKELCSMYEISTVDFDILL
jgi:5'-3' exonuclease